MDYKEKYEEALERARENYELKKTMGLLATADTIEAIFPELRESYDERIRKEIIDIVEAYRANCVYEGTHRFDDCLAYLKKQKELDKMIVVSHEVWDNAISDAFENGKKEGEKQKEQKPVENPFDANETMKMKDRIDEGFTKMMMQEQKPADGKYYSSPDCGTTAGYTSDESECDNDYRVGKTFSGLIPCWVNAPSELQPAHKYHGKNIVAMHDNIGGFRCVCIDDEKPTTFHLPENTLLVEGWRKEQKPSIVEKLREISTPANEDWFEIQKRWEKEDEQKPAEWKPQPESLEALMYAIEGKWEMIKPTSYLSRRLEDLYEGLVNTYNVDETFLAELPKTAYTAKDIEELRALKDKIDASMDEKPAEWSEDTLDEFTENIRSLITRKLTYHDPNGSGISSTVFIDDETAKDIANGVLFYVGKEAVKNPKREIPEWSEEDEMETINVFRPLAGTSIESATKQAVNKFTNSGKKFLLAFNGVFILIDNTKSVQDIVSEYNRSLGGKRWSEFDSDCLERAIWYVENPAPLVVKDTNLVLWLKSLPLNLKKKSEDVAKLCSNEWSKEDEEMLVKLLDSISIGNNYEEMRNWLLPKLKSLRPQWKPSEEQKYDGNMDKECIKLCDVLNSVPSIDTFESCCGHLKDRYSIWFFCNDIITISRLGRCVERNYSDGKWELLVDSTDTHPTGVFWLRSKVPFQSYDEMEKSINELCSHIQYWFNAKFDSYFNCDIVK